MTPRQLLDIHVTALTASWSPRQHRDATRLGRAARIEPVQQLNSVKLSGVAVRRWTGARFLEDEAAKILPQGYKIDYTGESRQLRSEANKFLPAFCSRSCSSSGAGRQSTASDPFVILAVGPLAMFGALLMSSSDAEPNMHFSPTGGSPR